jgi:hypothetical protein
MEVAIAENMKRRALVLYRTAEGFYGSLSQEIESEARHEGVLPWALRHLPSGSLIVSYRFETRPEYPVEMILKGLEK